MQGAASAWLSYALALHSLHKGEAKGLAQHALEKGMSASPAPQVTQHKAPAKFYSQSHTCLPPCLSSPEHTHVWALVTQVTDVMAGAVIALACMTVLYFNSLRKADTTWNSVSCEYVLQPQLHEWGDAAWVPRVAASVSVSAFSVHWLYVDCLSFLLTGGQATLSFCCCCCC